MSDLFAELGNFRFPDTRMNQGPLPSVAGGPVGSDGTPDSRINHTNELLRNITPYAFGQAARTGSDRNYQQVPHRVQQMVQQVAVPNPPGTAIVQIPHVVDNGELAFVMLSNGRSVFSYPYYQSNRPNPATIPQFGNLDVVNYVLCCLQQEAVRALPQPAAKTQNHWHLVFQEVTKGQVYAGVSQYEYWTGQADMTINLVGVGANPADTPAVITRKLAVRKRFYFAVASFLTSNIFIPFGICAGSEKQGGQHEGGHAPVQAAVNYVTTMTVDGQNRDLMNYWHAHTIQAGDRLILALRETRPPKTQELFSLNSYYKAPVTQTVTVGEAPYWQLKAQVYGCAAQEAAGLDFGEWDYRRRAYWHIAQTFQCRKGDAHTRSFHIAPPLQVTFSPVLQRMDTHLNGVPALPALAVAVRPAAFVPLAPGAPLTAAQLIALRATAARDAAAAAAAAAAALVAATTLVATTAAAATRAAAAVASDLAAPACVLANFTAIPEMQAILLFYGMYVLEVNGKMGMDIAYFGASVRPLDLFAAAETLRTDLKAARTAGEADITKRFLIRTIDAVRVLGSDLLAILKLCNSALLRKLAATVNDYRVQIPSFSTANGAIVIATDFDDGRLDTCSAELVLIPGLNPLEDTGLLDFIGHLCKNPWMYENKGVVNNALLQPCLSFLCVYNLCRLALQENDGKLADIYRNFDSFSAANIFNEVARLTPAVSAANGATRFCESYYNGHSKLQRGIEALQLDSHSRTLKNIGTFDAKATRYFNATRYIVVDVTEAIMNNLRPPYAGADIPAHIEFESFLEDYRYMSMTIAAHTNAFNGFNAMYNSTIALLRTAGADADAIAQSNKANLTAEAPNLEQMYNMTRQRLIWTTLYYRTTQEFYAVTPLVVGLPNNARFAAYYANAASLTDAPMLVVLEAIRDTYMTITWRTNSPMPVIRIRQRFNEILTDVQAAFRAGGVDMVALLPSLLTFMATDPAMRDSFNRNNGQINLAGLETFERGKPTAFSLNAALGDVEGAGEPGDVEVAGLSGEGPALGGSAAPKTGAAGKAVAKRAKKIRFELDDAQFPTIAEDAV